MIDNSIAQSLKSCLTLCGPMNFSIPGFSVHGILQARILNGCCFLLQGISPTQGLRHASPSLAGDSSPLAPPLPWCFFFFLMIKQFYYVGYILQILFVILPLSLFSSRNILNHLFFFAMPIF